MLRRKLWEKLQPLLKTSADKIPQYEGMTMWTSAGPVQSNLANADISRMDLVAVCSESVTVLHND